MAKTDKSARTIFICQQCGREEIRWIGRCPSCQGWNSFIEQAAPPKPAASRTSARSASQPLELSQVAMETADRLALPMEEVNRVLGGGIVPGSLVLTGGEPGIGKSTLLLQVAAMVANMQGSVVYVSGEETAGQTRLRAERLGIRGNSLFLLAETELDAILSRVEELTPGLLVIDSIQAIYLAGLDTSPGSVTQVRECTLRLMQWAKTTNVPVFIIGHVTKDGAIAGPKTLEHIVDVVLYLEGESFSAYRLLRCVKNRFGSTNEIGIFEMKGYGLAEVENPSLAFISQRPGASIGSVIVPVLEGSRPLLVEVQALTNPTTFGMPRRTANGVDYNRLLMITAVLTRRLGIKLGNQDIIVNVTGGLKISEPAADLGIALAIVSSFRDAPVRDALAAVGEIGLTGELRSVPQVERRISEAARLGFQRFLLPKSGEGMQASGIQLMPAATLREAINAGLGAPLSNAKEPPDEEPFNQEGEG